MAEMTNDKQHQKLLYYAMIFFGLLAVVAFSALKEHQVNRNLYTTSPLEGYTDSSGVTNFFY